MSIGGGDHDDLIDVKTSLTWNRNVGAANDAYFLTDDPGLSPEITQTVAGIDDLIDTSDSAGSSGTPLDYDFGGVEWLGAIMYEVVLSGEIEDLIGDGFVLTADSFINDIFLADPGDQVFGGGKGSGGEEPPGEEFTVTTSATFFHHSPSKQGSKFYVKVPESATYGLFGAGVLAAIIAQRRFRSKKPN